MTTNAGLLYLAVVAATRIRPIHAMVGFTTCKA